ncbi:MAG: hypothetical protein ACREPT_10605 [Rudaea sp.]
MTRKWINLNERSNYYGWSGHMRILFQSAIVTILLAACGTAPPISTGARHGQEQQALSADIYAIYSAALRFDARDSRKLGILRTTIPVGPECGNGAGMSPQVSEAMADMLRRSRKAQKLEAKFDLPFQYKFVDELEQVGGARPPPPGKSDAEFAEEQIAKLQKRIDEGYTEVALSLPGVSNDQSVAVVYIAISFSGSGYVLHREAGKWLVDPRKTFCNWIS